MISMDRFDFLERLKAQVSEHRQEAVLMLGDWNFVGSEDVRLSVGAEPNGGGDPISRIFDAMLVEFAELWQPYPTFGRRGGVGLSVLPRLDRVCTNSV